MTRKKQHHWETVLTTGNGYLGTRGSLEEHYPEDKAATFVHGLWDDTPVVYTELANAFDWTAIYLWINEQPFRLDHGQVTDYSRHLDMQRGEVRRSLRWTPPAATTASTTVEITFTRVANLADEHELGLRVTVTVLSGQANVRLRVRLDGQVENEGLLHWKGYEAGREGQVAWLTAVTRHTNKRLAQAMSLLAWVDQSTGPQPATLTYEDAPRNPGWSLATTLATNQTLTADKLVSIYTERDTADPVAAAIDKAKALASMGFATLCAANCAAWADFWQASDVIVEGDDEAQLALRHALYQMRIAAATHDEYVNIGARSLSGFGYRGHAFWDTEIYTLPFFIYTQPQLARNLLMYRYHTLPGARRKAMSGGFQGAQYAWESGETGDEVCPRWVPGPQGEELVRIWCGDIELHITADVAYGIMQYWQVTGDDLFMQRAGAQILLETACFWASRAEPDRPTPGQFSISNVIGPDEYHEHVDNNAYTNGLASWHLRTAIQLLNWLEQQAPAQAAELRTTLDLTPARLATWQQIADNLVLLRDPQSGLIEQFTGFFQRQEVDWPQFAGRTQSMQALLGIAGANAHQVLKQPDVVALLTLLRDHYPAGDLAVNWDYYNPRTDHTYGSSLGPALHAWAACELGKPDEAYEHFLRAARADIGDVRGNARDGIHIASSGGVWQATVFGFGGLRVQADGSYTTQARFPAHWQRLAFGFTLRGQRRWVDLRRP